MVSAANQMLWLTYAPITTDAAHHYGVSVSAIGWLAEIFPLVYVVLALPTGRLIDRSLGMGLGLGAALTAVGAVVRLPGDSYPLVLAGQVLIALGQPLVLNAVTAMASRSLRPADRPTGIAVASAGIFAGLVLALLSGSIAGVAHLQGLLLFQAAFALVGAGWLGFELRRLPEAAHPRPGERPDRPPLSAALRNRPVVLLAAMAAAGFGVFVAITTWLQA